MRLSMKGDYGVRAMLDLAERAGQGPIQSEAIARRQSISDAYLDQLLTLLRRAGLVRSVRGPRGGHELARAAGSITLIARSRDSTFVASSFGRFSNSFASSARRVLARLRSRSAHQRVSASFAS